MSAPTQPRVRHRTRPRKQALAQALSPAKRLKTNYPPKTKLTTCIDLSPLDLDWETEEFEAYCYQEFSGVVLAQKRQSEDFGLIWFIDISAAAKCKRLASRKLMLTAAFAPYQCYQPDYASDSVLVLRHQETGGIESAEQLMQLIRYQLGLSLLVRSHGRLGTETYSIHCVSPDHQQMLLERSVRPPSGEPLRFVRGYARFIAEHQFLEGAVINRVYPEDFLSILRAIDANPLKFVHGTRLDTDIIRYFILDQLHCENRSDSEMCFEVFYPFIRILEKMEVLRNGEFHLESLEAMINNLTSFLAHDDLARSDLTFDSVFISMETGRPASQVLSTILDDLTTLDAQPAHVAKFIYCNCLQRGKVMLLHPGLKKVFGNVCAQILHQQGMITLATRAGKSKAEMLDRCHHVQWYAHGIPPIMPVWGLEGGCSAQVPWCSVPRGLTSSISLFESLKDGDLSSVVTTEGFD